MKFRIPIGLLAVFALLPFTSPVGAVTVPFTEHFEPGTQGWKNTASTDPTHVASGGPDGSAYISTELSFLNLPSGPALFRAQDEFGSSGGAFEGNWLANNVGVLRAYIRHDAPIALDFFTRFATPANFPAAAVELPTSVQPGVWTLVEFDVSQSNPLLTVEGPPSFYNAVFSDLGHVQIGVSLPTELASDANTYTFNLDQVSIGVPEPTTSAIALAAVLGGFLGLRIRRR